MELGLGSEDLLANAKILDRVHKSALREKATSHVLVLVAP